MIGQRFDQRAERYHGAAEVQRELADWTAGWLPEKALGKHRKTLEVGAGTGWLTRHLVTRLGDVVATDLSPRMVTEGRRRVPAARWATLDAWSDPLPPGIDFLSSASLLQWCPDPVAVLSRWRHELQPEARMVHGIFCQPTLTEWREVSPVVEPLTWRAPAVWQAAFEQSGWKVARLEVATVTRDFPDALALLRNLHQTGAVAITRPPTRAGALRRALRTYQSRFPSAPPAQGVRATWSFLRVEVV